MRMGSLRDKVIAISGAAGGIGTATAYAVAARGAKLSLADMDSKTLDRVAQAIRDKDQTDVITTTVKRRGYQASGVNLAGILGKEFGKTGAHEIGDEDFDMVMKFNVRGLMACQRAQLRYIDDSGSIVNAASVAGKMGIANCLSYGVSKHAVIGLTRVAATENGHRNVRVNAIAPGSIDTKMLDQASQVSVGAAEGTGAPISRAGKPEEVAALIAYLLSDESAFTTGAVYTIDGGLTP